MFNSNGLSLADIASVTGKNNDSMWGGDGWWAIIIFAMIFGWGGFGNNNGWGNNGSATATGFTDSAIQRGFDNQAVMTKLDAITSGLSDGFYTANNAMLSGFNNLNTNVMQTGYGIQQAINADTVANMQNTNTLQAQLQNCCCENREATAQVRYDLATDTCAITNAIQNQTQQIMQNCNDNYRALHDELVQSQLDAKDAKILEQANAIQALNLAQSQATQNTYLINALKPTPIPSFPASNLYGGLYGGTCSGCNGGTVSF